MQQILIGIIIMLGLATYYFHSENQILQANNSALEGAVATQEEAIQTIQADFKMQTEQLQDLTLKSQEAQKELNGTKHIMEDIEKLSDTVDSLDDGLQLQPVTN